MSQSLPSAIVAQLDLLGGALLALVQAQRGASLAEHEAGVRAAVHAALPGLLTAVVQGATPDLAPGVTTVHRRCPRCDHLTPLHDQRPRTVGTTCGPLRLVRPWYACPVCRQGFSPADATLALPAHARLSPALVAWLVELGATTTYREAARVLSRLTGLTVASDTIRAHTTAVGTQVADAEDAAIAQVQTTREAAAPGDPAPGTLVVEADGVMVRYHDGWHEVKIGVVGGTRDGAVVAHSYVAAREAAADFGPRLVAEAARRGALAVVRWEGGLTGRALAVLRPVHVLGDGAAWIWTLAAEHFGDRTEVVDFYHAAEHLWAVAHALYGDQTDEARVAAMVAVRVLRTLGGTAVGSLLAAARADATTPAAREVLRVERGYFATHAHRMAYPALTDQHLPIGSGAVESSAAHVVQQRMKRPGQRWSASGGRAMLALRGRVASARPLVPAA